MITPDTTTIIQSGSSDLTTIATIIGSFVVMVGGFMAYIRLMFNQASRDREADRTERQALTDGVNKMAESNEKIAIATTQQANESAERNGHLAELVLQGNKLVSKDVEINKGIRSSLEKSAIIAAEDRESLTHPIQAQNIDKQVVSQQIIKEKEKEK